MTTSSEPCESGWAIAVDAKNTTNVHGAQARERAKQRYMREAMSSLILLSLGFVSMCLGLPLPKIGHGGAGWIGGVIPKEVGRHPFSMSVVIHRIGAAIMSVAEDVAPVGR